VHVPSSIDATEAEEVGVEHLLRDIKDAAQGSLAARVQDKTLGLKVLAGKLKEMKEYLENVISGKYRYNSDIIHNYQDIFNLLPNLKVEETVRNFSVKSNDYMYVVYVSSMIRSILSLHDLINNKIQMKEIEVEQAKKDKQREEDLKKKKEEEAKKKVEAALAKGNELAADAEKKKDDSSK